MTEFRSRREAHKYNFSCIDCYDPGIGYAGYAQFRDGLLFAAQHFKPGALFAVVEAPEHAWRPVRDILRLARVAGEIGGLYPDRLYVAPAEWKGSTPKGVHQNRILSRLTDAERALLPTKKTVLVHTLDAVGIGLWYLGRL